MGFRKWDKTSQKLLQNDAFMLIVFLIMLAYHGFKLFIGIYGMSIGKLVFYDIWDEFLFLGFMTVISISGIIFTTSGIIRQYRKNHPKETDSTYRIVFHKGDGENLKIKSSSERDMGK